MPPVCARSCCRRSTFSPLSPSHETPPSGRHRKMNPYTPFCTNCGGVMGFMVPCRVFAPRKYLHPVTAIPPSAGGNVCIKSRSTNRRRLHFFGGAKIRVCEQNNLYQVRYRHSTRGHTHLFIYGTMYKLPGCDVRCGLCCVCVVLCRLFRP